MSRATSSARTRRRRRLRSVSTWVASALVTLLPGTAGGSDDGASAVFRDESAAIGLDFVHFNGMSGELYAVEVAGAGAAVFDYDNDGDLDLYLIQGRMLGRGKEVSAALFPPRHPLPLTDRLYRNDLEVSAEGGRRRQRPPGGIQGGDLQFTDVTLTSQLKATGYGMGVATGDFDNDGWVDLYVTNYGPNQLWKNNGDGTFRDVTAASGTGDRRWSVSATFFDFDRDGWLDLYVANYVDFSEATHKICRRETGARDYCGPQSFTPESDRLFRNRGDGTFEDVTSRSGLAKTFGAGLGAVAADFDGDGWLDLYVANDMWPNQLWMNQRAGADGRVTFRDDALLAGAAVDAEGRPQASMGVDAADFDGDGDEDLFMTHLDKQTNTLYVNDGQGFFHDASFASGLGAASWNMTAFGTAFFDYDNDGRLDLLAVNGAVYVIQELARRGDPFPLHQPNQLFRNLGDGDTLRFADVSAEAGEVFALSEVSRGAAFGDLDNDGDTDVVVTNNNGPARVLVNLHGQDRHWIGLRLLGGTAPRDMLGSRVEVRRAGQKPLVRRVASDGSYASANDPRVLVGLGESTAVESVRVLWPNGQAEEWRQVPIDAYTTLVQGKGTPVP